ncbi:MAG: caspase family protein [Prevotella sp.]|nr:caspase family protein [Prevotella sp.]
MKKLFLLAMMLISLLGVQAQRTYALVCGVSQYDDPTGQCVDLNYPAKGVKMMKNVFQKAGFVTSVLTSRHVTEENVMDRLNAIVQIAQPNDKIIFQFIGHGSTGKIHLYQGLPFYYSKLMSTLSKARTDKVFCIIDACQSGSAIGVAKELKEGHQAFLMACKAEEYTMETSVIASPVFTMSLSKGLRGRADINGDRKVTLMELFRYVHSDLGNRGRSFGIQLHPQLLGNGQLFETVLVELK